MGNMSEAVQAEHTRIEQTELARMMEQGTVTRDPYISYLQSSLLVWWALEEQFELARELGVAARLMEDNSEMVGSFSTKRASRNAKMHSARVKAADLRVLGLGLCYGGKVMAKRIRDKAGFPVSHLHLPDGARDKLHAVEAPQKQILEAFAQTRQWYEDAVQ